MRYLMDNAAARQQSLGLQFGVSLSAEQVASLDKSIIWWEASSVNGETVMVPKVYLSQKDVSLQNGSVIAGNNVSLQGGNITNSGSTVAAQNDLKLDSGNQFSNLNAGLLQAGGDLQLSALGDINNVSSTISGKTVALESVNGDISNITTTQQWTLDASNNWGQHKFFTETLSGPVASIAALDSLSLKAGNDISVTGAKLGAGGDMRMAAWNDIAITSNKIETGNAQSGFSHGWQKADATRNSSLSSQGSQLSAGGNLAMQAGHNLDVTASTLKAGGDGQLAAGNDINLNAAATRQSNQNGNYESHSSGVDRTTISGGGVLQGLVNGNIPQSVAGGINPLMAQTIKAYTTNPDSTVNREANLMAHAVWGAVVAQMSGGNAGAGAAGAFSGELASRYISENYYNARTAEEISRLSESDRQEISLLSTLAAGAAGGLIGDSRAAIVTGAQAGKNAVENNWLSVQEADRKNQLETKRDYLKQELTPAETKELADINQADKARNKAIKSICTDGNKGGAACGALVGPAQEALKKYGENVSYSLIYKDLYPQDAANLENVLKGVDAGSISRDQAITAIAASTHRDWNDVAKDYDSAMQTQAIAVALAGMKGFSSVESQGKNVSREVKSSTSSSTKPSSETYFRVEGGGSGTQTSQNGINVNSDGSVTINSGCSGQLCVSTNGPNHAAYYLTNRRQDGTVVVFEVDAKLHKQIMDTAVPQRPISGVPKDPNAPKIVDPTKGQPSVSLELPKVWDELIEKNSSNARILTKEEFLNEFGK